MFFWLAAAGLTIIAALSVLWPWLRRSLRVGEAHSGDIAVYRDQLEEVGRDVDRGLIGAAEADEARAEIGRRMIRADEEAKKGAGTERNLRAVRLVMVLAVPVIAWAAYAGLGSPGLPSQPLAERMARNPAQNSIEELVARAEMHLRANPDDTAGWEVVAPIYMRLGRAGDAVNAYTTLIRLSGATADREAGLGEALLARDDGVIGNDAKAAFERALALDGKSAKAKFFLALALAQGGQVEEAKTRWSALIDETDPNSPWAGASREAIGQLDGQPKAVDRGPSESEVAAASEMSAGDRAGMIESMVAQLDARLRENPGDADGWKKLVRSYVVMGKADEARAAIVRAEKGLNAGQIDELKQFAREAGLTGIE